MIRLEVRAEAVPVAERLFREYPKELAKHLRVAMVNAEVEVLFRLKQNVHVITGTLRRSWQAKPVEQGEDGVGWKGGAGSTLVYAPIEEYGRQGTEQVRAHTRRIRSRDVKTREKVFATTFNASGETATKTTTRRAVVAQGFAYVRAHTRRVNRPAHPYARPALADSRTAIVRLHELAIGAANEKLTREIESAERRNRV